MKYDTQTLPTFVNSINKQWIGADRLLDDLMRTANQTFGDSFPPYNVVKQGDNEFVIEMAVAGYDKSELDITMHEGVLTVKGEKAEKSEEETPTYLYRGIASRNFTRRFNLADFVEVNTATVENGILKVFLTRIVPEEHQPRKVDIS